MTSLEQPLVSIVTPCLNAQRYIEECIASVRAQDYPGVEHVIVDGRSTDGTLSIVERYVSKYNLRWISEKDKNASEATNKGMRLAKGEILGILPSDDIYLPWTTRTIVEKFNENPSTDVVYGDLVQVPFGHAYGMLYFNPPEQELRTHLRFNSIGGMAVFFRRNVFDSLNGFDENLRIVSDYDFWLRGARQFKFAKVNEALACFRYRRESISMCDSSFHARERSKLREKHPRGAALGFFMSEFRYYARRFSSIAELLLKLYAETGSQASGDRPWGNLLESNCISRSRLIRELVFLPLFFTNLLQQEMRLGYIDVEKLIGSVMKSSL